jgi:hypothetical protein
MHHQAHSNIQMFTIFGAYVFERRGDYSGRRETQQSGQAGWAPACATTHVSANRAAAR